MARCSREGWTDTRLGGVWAKVGVLCRSEYVSIPKAVKLSISLLTLGAADAKERTGTVEETWLLQNH